MHKNNEGYADPTAGKAINGVRREEYQKYLEELHGVKRGQIVTLIHFAGENRQQETLRKYKYRVVELHNGDFSNAVQTGYESVAARFMGADFLALCE